MNVRTHIYISRKRKYNLERCVSKVFDDFQQSVHYCNIKCEISLKLTKSFLDGTF